LRLCKVIWTEESLENLDEIFDFLIISSLSKASQVIESILKREEQLVIYPKSGAIQKSRKNKYEYRYLVEDNYKIVYHLKDYVVFIDTVFDTRQNPDKMNV